MPQRLKALPLIGVVCGWLLPRRPITRRSPRQRPRGVAGGAPTSELSLFPARPDQRDELQFSEDRVAVAGR